MTTLDDRDPILRLLSSLPRAVPPKASDQRVRSRCYAVLAASHTPLERRDEFAGIAPRVIDAALALTGFIYAAAAGFEALRLAGLL
jgi:hypothetical protein